MEFEVLRAVAVKSSIFWDISVVSCKALLATCFHAGFLFVSFFDPDDGDDMFLRNVG
jgi:hypothetical protein